MRIAVFGLGYVGLVTALCLTDNGHQVTGVEKDAGKLDALRRGVTPIREPGVEELLATGLSSGAFDLTDDANSAVSSTDMALICVGTPSSPSGGTDLTAVLAVTGQIGRALRDGPSPYAVVARSTVPPGTTRDYITPVLTDNSQRVIDADLSLYFNPEFLRQGSAIADFHRPPFVVLGTQDGKPPLATAAIHRLYAPSGAEHVVLNYQEAELLKIACNAFHALKIDFCQRDRDRGPVRRRRSDASNERFCQGHEIEYFCSIPTSRVSIWRIVLAERRPLTQSCDYAARSSLSGYGSHSSKQRCPPWPYCPAFGSL